MRCEPPSFLDHFVDRTMFAKVVERDGVLVAVGYLPSDGIDFLDTLPMRFRNGYLTCRRVR